jgi:hypothetical protein
MTVQMPGRMMVATDRRGCCRLQVQLMRQIEKSQREWADGRRQRDKEILQLRRKVRSSYVSCQPMAIPQPAALGAAAVCWMDTAGSGGWAGLVMALWHRERLHQVLLQHALDGLPWNHKLKQPCCGAAGHAGGGADGAAGGADAAAGGGAASEAAGGGRLPEAAGELACLRFHDRRPCSQHCDRYTAQLCGCSEGVMPTCALPAAGCQKHCTSRNLGVLLSNQGSHVLTWGCRCVWRGCGGRPGRRARRRPPWSTTRRSASPTRARRCCATRRRGGLGWSRSWPPAARCASQSRLVLPACTAANAGLHPV